jgi:antitoxin MazE
MTATLKLVRIGNSKGIRIPQQLIRHCRLGDEVILEATKKGLLLRPVREGKLSMEDSFKAMAKDKKSTAEAREWAESGLPEGLNEN